MDISFSRLRVIVALEVENPVGIEMGMHGHVESVGILPYAVVSAVLV
jgi:hypothetical protein